MTSKNKSCHIQSIIEDLHNLREEKIGKLKSITTEFEKRRNEFTNLSEVLKFQIEQLATVIDSLENGHGKD